MDEMIVSSGVETGTVIPIKYTHSLVSFEFSSLFAHIIHVCFTAIGAIMWWPEYQWNNLE